MQNIINLEMAIDNSNTAGVTGDGDYTLPTTDTNGGLRPAGDPQNVTKGIEFSIPLTALGNASGTGIKLTAFINNGGHDYLANQVSGVGILRGNIMNLMPDFELEFSPNGEKQYVVVPNPVSVAANGAVPEPGGACAGGIGSAGCWSPTRRRTK